MNTSEEAARSLRKSVSDNRAQMDLTEESRLLLRDTLKDDMGDAFAAGLKNAMNSENARLFVRAMFSEAQTLAAEKSVEVAGGVLKALAVRMLTFLLLGWIVYSVGGWTALAGFAKFLSAAKG